MKNVTVHMLRIEGFSRGSNTKILDAWITGSGSCKTPSYVKEQPSTKPAAKLPLASEVSYFVADDFKNEEIGCIAVAKFTVKHDDTGYADIDQAAITRGLFTGF